MLNPEKHKFLDEGIVNKNIDIIDIKELDKIINELEKEMQMFLERRGNSDKRKAT